MAKVWGMDVAKLGWEYESGGKFDPDEIYPVVDVIESRLYGIKRKNEEDVVVVHSYHPTAQKKGAENFARMVWGKPETWPKPDVSTRVVMCLGAPACYACLSEPLPAMDIVPNWRIQPHDADNRNGVLYAKQLLDPSDPDCLLTTESHVLARTEANVDEKTIERELLRRCIALFGEPFNLAAGMISPSYREMYRMKD